MLNVHSIKINKSSKVPAPIWRAGDKSENQEHFLFKIKIVIHLIIIFVETPNNKFNYDFMLVIFFPVVIRLKLVENGYIFY